MHLTPLEVLLIPSSVMMCFGIWASVLKFKADRAARLQPKKPKENYVVSTPNGAILFTTDEDGRTTRTELSNVRYVRSAE
jgi:hypothetical protein